MVDATTDHFIPDGIKPGGRRPAVATRPLGRHAPGRAAGATPYYSSTGTDKRIDVGQGPHGIRASRDGRRVYASVTGTDKVAVIDARTLKVVKQIPTHGKLPFWIAVAGND